MKIGIFTFHCAINYGAVLQAYCLQEYLKSLGHDVYIIDYRPNYLTKPYKTFNYQVSPRLSILENTKAFIRALFTAIIRNKRKKRFNLFINQRLRLIDFETAKHSHFDLLVYGSDQIWNPKITEGYDAIYFGAFTGIQCDKKISYAASIGSVSNIECPEIFHQLLRNINKIGVREKSLQNYIYDNFGLYVEVTLDPVLLADPLVLINIVDERDIPQTPYLLLFTLRNDEQVRKYAFQTAKDMQLPLIHVVSDAESLFDSNLRQIISPEKLLGYIKNAKFVISSSFHGIAISIALQKQFCAIKTSANITERIQQLLISLRLESRLTSMDKIVPNESINYTTISQELSLLRAKSGKFITTSTI